MGDRLALDGGRLEVRAMDKHRITQVLFQHLAMDAGTGETKLADEGSSSPGDLSDTAEPESPEIPGGEPHALHGGFQPRRVQIHRRREDMAAKEPGPR